MIVTVKGFGRSINKKLEESARFFAQKLMHTRMVENLEIEIKKDRNLDCLGECDCVSNTRNPRVFKIVLKGAGSTKDLLRTLAHEMIHVRQYAKNELGSYRDVVVTRGTKLKTATKWKGEWWTPKRDQDEYFDSPWEIEAYGVEPGLWHKWVTRNKKKNS
jgi:RNAse (barnase) inhibitor barstar